LVNINEMARLTGAGNVVQDHDGLIVTPAIPAGSVRRRRVVPHFFAMQRREEPARATTLEGSWMAAEDSRPHAR
jgi:hypothetical protein